MKSCILMISDNIYYTSHDKNGLKLVTIHRYVHVFENKNVYQLIKEEKHRIHILYIHVILLQNSQCIAPPPTKRVPQKAKVFTIASSFMIGSMINSEPTDRVGSICCLQRALGVLSNNFLRRLIVIIVRASLRLKKD